jgi:hypothetical protein
MRIRPGDRPPVQRSANRPLNVELLQALEGRSGNWAALRLSEPGKLVSTAQVRSTLQYFRWHGPLRQLWTIYRGRIAQPADDSAIMV